MKGKARTRSRGSVFAPSATKMREMRNKMPAASVYLLENLHFLPFFVADSVPGGIIFGRGGLENDEQVAQNLSIFGLLSGRIAGVGGSGDVPAATI